MKAEEIKVGMRVGISKPSRQHGKKLKRFTGTVKGLYLLCAAIQVDGNKHWTYINYDRLTPLLK